ncbi:hypothetical protein H8356DRAFT_1364571 [Neocallimastix lanati (nom. inval.)]|nr:hypothetical protein H8356DRAFT_1364571 [Neocallimastix sp. JGI-2020a]
MEYRTTLGMLSVLAVGGKEIKGRSMFSVSPYITFQIDHMKKKTKVSKGKGKNPKWNDLIEFEIIKGRDVLNGKVMGKEISEDEFIGDIKVDLKPIFQKGYAEMWVPVIHPHKNRHKGDVFLKLQYKPTPQEPGYGAPMPPMGAPMGGPPRPLPPPGAPMGGPPRPLPPQGAPMGGPPRPLPPQGAPMGGPARPIPIRPGPGVQIPPRQGAPMPSPINVGPRGASPNIRPFPSPIPQRQGSAMQARPPIRQVEEPQSYDHSLPPPPPGGELKHAMTTPAPHMNNTPPMPSRSQTYNPPPPQRSGSHQLPPRQMSHPQIQTNGGPGVSPRIQPPRSPRSVSPGPNGIPQRMPRPPMGPRPAQ